MARAISARERHLLFGAAALLVLFLGARPIIDRVAVLGPRSGKLLAEKMKVIAAYRQAVGRESSLAADAAALGAEINAYEEALLPGATPPLAAADLQTLLKQFSDRAGLKIQSEKILPHVKRDAYLEIPVQIVANGEMRNLKDFLVAVDSSKLFVGVQNVGLRTVKRRQFVAETRSYTDTSDIQASMTFIGLIHTGRD
ncbi:MAG: type II secretion system protein GspM [Candidatus Methylomirabilia bacterium]